MTLKYLTLSKEFEDVTDVAFDEAGVEGGDGAPQTMLRVLGCRLGRFR